MNAAAKTLGALDYAAVGLYLALIAGIGVFFGRYVKNVGDYLKGGGTIPWFAAGISSYMGFFSTFVFVAYAGIAYSDGLVSLVILWSTVPATLVGATLLAKRWRRAGVMTPLEYLETRFNGATRQLLSWSGLAFRLLDNMVRLYALGVFVAAATQLDLRVSVVGAGVAILAYTVTGGLLAVVVAEVVQFAILLFATLLMVPLSLRAVGGMAVLAERIPAHLTLFNGAKGTFWYLFAYYVMVSVKYNGNWAFIQRLYSVRDEAAARKAGYLTAGLFAATSFAFLLPSVAARVVFPSLANPEMAYVSMALHVLPSGLMGLLLAAMFAATMSSASSEFNVMSAVVTRDIYVRLVRPGAAGREQVLVARLATLAIACTVVVGALFIGGFGGAFEANKLFTGLAVPLAIPLVAGVLLRGPRPWGAVACIVAGIGTGLVLNARPGVSWAAATLIEIAVAVGTLLLSGVVGRADARYRERVAAFFARLATPVLEADKPAPAPEFQRSLAQLFAVVFAIVGGLYLAMSVPSIGQLGGRLGVGVSALCVLLAFVMHRVARRFGTGAAAPAAAPAGPPAQPPTPALQLPGRP